MAGIFGDNLFHVSGLGQTTAAEDAEFNATIASLATPTTGSGTSTGTKTGGAAYLPGVPSTGTKTGGAAYLPGTTAPVAVAPPRDNTTLYVVGGVAALGILGLIMMSNRRGTVAANRGRRSRRSRVRGR